MKELELELVTEIRKILTSLEKTKLVLWLYSENNICYYNSDKATFVTNAIIKVNPKIMSNLNEIIKANFDWDYRLEAKFLVYIDMEKFGIEFHEPVLTYKVTTNRLDES